MLFRVLSNPNISQNCADQSAGVFTIGNFDGVHLGHQALVEQVKTLAAKLQAVSAVVLFEPQPQEFFLQDKAPPRLMNFRQKVQALFQYGVQRVVICRFSAAFAALSPLEFVQSLQQIAPLAGVVVGDDFHFGAQRAGDFETLQAFGEQLGFVVSAVTSQLAPNGEHLQRVSSSEIRALVAKAQFQQAAALLTRPYYMSAKIEYGQQLGRKINVPTANLRPVQAGNRPAVSILQGVYAGWAAIEDQAQPLHSVPRYPVVGNFGYRPSVNGKIWRGEIHLIDTTLDNDALYSKRLIFIPETRLRTEKTFDSLAELRQAIDQDIQAARDFLSSAAVASSNHA